MSKRHVSRRKIIEVGAKSIIGGGMMLGGFGGLAQLLPNTAGLSKIRKALLMGSNEALAQAVQVAPNPVIQICLIDKIQQALILDTPGTIGAGDLNGLDGVGQMYDGVDISGQTLPANAINFRGINLSGLFGGRLTAGLATGYNVALMPQFTSQSGGHSLQNSDVGMDEGGLNFILEKDGKGTGMLGAVGFEIEADANNSRESFVSPGRVPMQTYQSAAQIRGTLKNSVAPLNTPDVYLDFRRKLDSLATKNTEVLDTLLSIKDRVDPALPELITAMTASDIVKQQVLSVIALAKAGLGSNFMIAIPWDDTNGGGNLSNPGGDYGISPQVGTAMLADVYTTISQLLPEAVTIIVSDGGRSRNNGDAAGGMTIVSGPANMVNNGVFGSVTQLDDLGSAGRIAQNGQDINLSDGNTTRILEHKHVLSLVAKITHDVDTGVPYPLGVSPIAS